MKNKKVILAMVMGIMLNAGIFAQGTPVIDITNILSSIYNGFTMVEQLNSMYENLKTSYEQLQQQIKSFEPFDFTALNAKDPLGAWNSINTYANRMLTYEANIDSIINRKDIKIGNGSYSLGDIFTTPAQSTQNMTSDGQNFTAIDPLETQLTPEERMVFHKKYGMSFGNYTRLNEIGEMLKKKSAEVVGYSNNIQQNLAEDREHLETIAGDLFDSESTIQQQQINNAVMSVMAQDIKTQANLLGDIAQQLAMNFSQGQTLRQAMQEEININDLGFADGLMQMLKEMQSSSAYR